jgi:hypothetical protein
MVKVFCALQAQHNHVIQYDYVHDLALGKLHFVFDDQRSF